MKKANKHLVSIAIAVIGLIADLLLKDWNCSMLWVVIIIQSIQLYKFETKQTTPNDVDEKPSKN